jgi:hypothetical protein
MRLQFVILALGCMSHGILQKLKVSCRQMGCFAKALVQNNLNTYTSNQPDFPRKIDASVKFILDQCLRVPIESVS